MELILNLLWVLLALPAFLVWRNGASGPRPLRWIPAFRGMLLGCVLLLLFPVVSATDDMRALRTELEETSFSKQIRNAEDHKGGRWASASSTPAAQPAALAAVSPSDILWGWTSQLSASRARPGLRGIANGRSPPASLLA